MPPLHFQIRQEEPRRAPVPPGGGAARVGGDRYRSGWSGWVSAEAFWGKFLVRPLNLVARHATWRGRRVEVFGGEVIVLGVILLIIGWLTGISILYTVGGILLVVGLILLLLGSVGRPVGGRRWYF